MSQGSDITKILDGRTRFQAGKNYKISTHNEMVAMQGLESSLSLKYGVMNVWSEKIDDKEEWLDGRIHVKPDYFLYANVEGKDEIKKWTIEVKTTPYKHFYNDEIIVKAPQVWTCKYNRNDFPIPYVLASTETIYALIPMGSFWNSPPQSIRFKNGVTKKGYILRPDDYEWHNHISPLRFKNKGDYV